MRILKSQFQPKWFDELFRKLDLLAFAHSLNQDFEVISAYGKMKLFHCLHRIADETMLAIEEALIVGEQTMKISGYLRNRPGKHLRDGLKSLLLRLHRSVTSSSTVRPSRVFSAFASVIRTASCRRPPSNFIMSFLLNIISRLSSNHTEQWKGKTALWKWKLFSSTSRPPFRKKTAKPEKAICRKIFSGKYW